jgi:hypothetical protein
VSRIFKQVETEFGSLDIFVSNARTEAPTYYEPPMEITFEHEHPQIAVRGESIRNGRQPPCHAFAWSMAAQKGQSRLPLPANQCRATTCSRRSRSVLTVDKRCEDYVTSRNTTPLARSCVNEVTSKSGGVHLSVPPARSLRGFNSLIRYRFTLFWYWLSDCYRLRLNARLKPITCRSVSLKRAGDHMQA